MKSPHRSSFRNPRRLLPLVGSLLALLGTSCASARPTLTVTSQPTGAMIQVDGRNVGKTPVSQELRFDKQRRVVVTASQEGFHPEELTLAPKSHQVEEGHLKFVLLEDEAWKVTTTSEATNQWLRVQVDPSIHPDDVWQKLVDSITTRYSNIEQLDDASGYIRTTTETRKFQGPQGSYRVRTRFLGSISSRSPLVYKFKIEAMVTDRSGDWLPYIRVFKEDALLVEELRDRLGIK